MIRRGRPPNPDGPMVNENVRLPVDMLAGLRVRADAAGLPVTMLIRNILESELSTHPKQGQSHE